MTFGGVKHGEKNQGKHPSGDLKVKLVEQCETNPHEIPLFRLFHRDPSNFSWLLAINPSITG